MKIIQITAGYYQPRGRAFVYGLGDDNKVYIWSPRAKAWLHYEGIPQTVNKEAEGAA